MITTKDNKEQKKLFLQNKTRNVSCLKLISLGTYMQRQLSLSFTLSLGTIIIIKDLNQFLVLFFLYFFFFLSLFYQKY